VEIPKGKRFGLHNLRLWLRNNLWHWLSSWLVSKAKTDPKTVQGLLMHVNVKSTLQLYARADSGETRAAQGVASWMPSASRRRCNELWTGL
jgi:hypothetical protein